MLSRREMSADEYITMNVKLRDRGWYDQAKLTIDKALKLEPENATAWDRLSYTLSRLKRHTEALEAARKCLELDPDYDNAYFRLAYALSQLDRDEESADAYRQYLDRQPASTVGLNNLGSVLRRLGRLEEAREVLEKALRIDPNYRYAQDNLSSLLFAQMRQAREQGLSTGEFLSELQRFRMRESHTERIEEYEQLLKVNPRDNGTRAKLAGAYLRNHQFERAIEQFEIMLDYDPHSADARQGLGICYERQGNVDAAILEYRQAVELDKSDSAYRLSLAEALHYKAVGVERKVVPRPSPPVVADSAEVDKPLLREAVEEYRKAIALGENSESVSTALVWWQRSLANAYEQLGELDKAKAIREKLPPGPEERIFGVGGPSDAVRTARDLREEGKTDEAIQVLEKALQDDPGDLPAIYLLGNLYLREKEQYNDAIRTFEKLPEAERNGESFFAIRIQTSLADAYDRNGQPEKAEEIRSKLPAGRGRGFGPGGGNRPSEAVLTALGLTRAGKIDEAVELLETVTPDDPGYTVALVNLSGLYQSLKRYDDAIATSRKLLEAESDNQSHDFSSSPKSIAYAQIASSLLKLHRVEEAHRLLDDALAADPTLKDQFQFQEMLGSVLIEKGEFEKALDHLCKADEISFRGSITSMRFGIIWALLQRGQLDAATAECERMLKDKSRRTGFERTGYPIDGAQVDAGFAWCELLRYDLNGDLSHLEKALKYARSGCESEDEEFRDIRVIDDPCRLPLGICQYRQGEFAQALKTLEKAYEKVEYDPHTWVFLAMTHWQLDHKDEARQWLERVEKHLKKHKPLPILKRYFAEAKKLIP
jgi:tetratricopeptide (TPR) repeat protein